MKERGGKKWEEEKRFTLLEEILTTCKQNLKCDYINMHA